MSGEKWTAGPWEAEEWIGPDCRLGFEVAQVNATPRETPTRYIARMMGDSEGPASTESEANARLIAAAPTMAAVLADVVMFFAGTDAPLGKRARAALAKARGER